MLYVHGKYKSLHFPRWQYWICKLADFLTLPGLSVRECSEKML